MRQEGGTYVVPVLINNAITLDFLVDSGAADVSIPADVVLTLMRTGTVRSADFLGSKTYVLADGSKVPSETFRIRSLKVGNIVLENVTAAVADVKATLLLGQSFFGRFATWSIDNRTHTLILGEVVSGRTVSQRAAISPPPQPPPVASVGRDRKLSTAQEDAVRRTIAPCWNIDPGALGSGPLAVELKLTLNADGTVHDVTIQDAGRYARDSNFRLAADAARRAVTNPRCHKLPLPADQYASWQTLYLRFDPRDILR
jgi:clan AA aspartic protease (TIGR02281 family)